MDATNTSQPVSTAMNKEDEPLHTAVPSNDEVWKISYYCRYHYYVPICSNPQRLPPFVFRLTSCPVLVCLHHPIYLLERFFFS